MAGIPTALRRAHRAVGPGSDSRFGRVSARRGAVGIGGGVGLTLALLTASCHDESLVVPKDPPSLDRGPQGDANSAGAGAAASRPSVVLLRRHHSRLVPLCCYDHAAQKLRAGQDCADLLPAEAEVRVGNAYGGRVQREGSTVCRTPDGETRLSTFRLIDGPPVDAGPRPGPPLALWSQGPAPKLELPPDPPDPLPLPPSEAQYITNAARNLLPPAQRLLLGKVVVDNVWTVDLDIDGLRERLDQVRLLELRGRFAMLTGVFVVAGKDAVALRPLRVQIVPSAQRERLGPDDHSHDVKMIAAIDLDYDRRRELWLQVQRPDATTDAVGRYTDTGVAVFAELTCPSEPPERPAGAAVQPAPRRP